MQLSQRLLSRRGFAGAVFLLTFLLLVAAKGPAGAVEVERVVSPGGIEAWLVEDHSNPIISLELAFRGGAATDPEGKAGLAKMVSGLLDEGAGELDSQAFQRELADLSIEISFGAGLDSFTGSLSTLSRNRERAFDLLGLALTEPRFDEEPVARIRGQLLAAEARRLEDPDTIAERALWRILFPDHPYGRPVSGTLESLQAIGREDLGRFVRERLVREHLYIGVSGDIAPAELARLLDRAFGALPAEGAPLEVAEVSASRDGGLAIAERDLAQSVVAFGEPGLKRDDPDYYAAYVVNYVLGGGGFASRLFEEVREKRGLAYGVYSYLVTLDHAGVIVGGVATQNQRVAQSLAVIREEWRRMAVEGPTAEELEDAKTYLTGSFPLRLSSTGKIAGMLAGIQLEGLGIDYLDKRNSYIESVTLEQAKAVARSLYDPAALSLVVVGKPKDVTATRDLPGAS